MAFVIAVAGKNRRKGIALFAMLVCFVAAAVGMAADVPVFTDHDLEKYKKAPGHFSVSTPSPAETFIPVKETEKHAKYEVPYKDHVGRARRIIVNVTLDGSITVPMALDTGATGMLISSRLAEKLGIFKGNEGKLLWAAGGIGGTVPAVITVINTVQVGKARDEFIPTIVTKTAFEGFEGLIGMDFMANYSVHIDTKNRVVVFEEIPARPNMPGGHDEAWWRTTFHEFATMQSTWKKYRDYLYGLKDENYDLKVLRELADRQLIEAEKLMTKLNGYAIDYMVPMEWRKY